ncbi:unnamed protein product [Symbiodinium sp. CCMP2592]|nr:unnamed protein product [Symbiodinium sp. CCMP2592]
MGGGNGAKDMPQKRWVEKTEPHGKGHRGGWQPTDVTKQQAMMSPGGKSYSKERLERSAGARQGIDVCARLGLLLTRSGQTPSMDTNQKAGSFTGQSQGKCKKDGRDGGKHHDDDNMGGGKGAKDMPQKRWVEKTEPHGKGHRGGWQPTDVTKQQAMQQVPMSPGGKSNSKGSQPLTGRGMGGPGPKNQKGVGRDPGMDACLSFRFQGQIPATATGSTNMRAEKMLGDEDEERWYSLSRERKGAGKQGGGKGQAKGKGCNGKGKAKGGKGGGSRQRASR